MKNSKIASKAFAILISVVMLLSALPLSVFAEESGTFTYKEVGDEVTIVSYQGNEEYITVPETYNGKPVTQIGPGAFAGLIYAKDENDKTITQKVTLPNTIKKIGFMAFAMTEAIIVNLNELTNLEYIGAYAFMGSELSGDIVLPNSVTYVGSSAFTSTLITSLHLGKNVNLPVPESSKGVLGYISRSGTGAPNSMLNSVQMKSTGSEKSIALCCSELTKITVDIRNPYYRSINGVLYSKDMTKLYSYPSGKQNSIYVMPDTVDNFYNAFGGFYINPISIMGITFDLFDSGKGVLGNTTNDLVEASRFSCDLKSVVISDRVTNIVDIAFYNTGLESVFIPASVTSIGSKAFWHCTELNTVGFDLNSSFTSLPKECFKDCTSLKNITFGRIKYLEALAFENCSSLQRIDLTNVLSTESTVFDGCTNLTDVVYQNSDTTEKATVSKQAFDNMNSIETVMLGSSVEKVEAKAFANCQNLKVAYISDEIESIDNTAFSGCNNLTIVCPSETCYAYSYAEANNIPVTTLQVMPIPNQTYTGLEITPELTVKSGGAVLTSGRDYSTYYKDNIDAGLATATVMGEGSYNMFASVCKFAIVRRNINDGVEISTIEPQMLTGEKVEPQITVTYNGKELIEGVDYIVEYSNNTEAGIATVAVMGQNNFVGVYTQEFEILGATKGGDANNDGVIDVNDYSMVVSYIMCEGTLSNEQKMFADFNKDGVIDAVDAIAIDCYINGVL